MLVLLLIAKQLSGLAAVLLALLLSPVMVMTLLKAQSIPELQAVLSSAPRGDNGQIKVSRSMLATFPDQLSAVASTVATKYSGSELAAIDGLIPGEDKYHGTAQP